MARIQGDLNDATTFNQVFTDLETINQVISDTQLLFNNLLDETRVI